MNEYRITERFISNIGKIKAADIKNTKYNTLLIKNTMITIALMKMGNKYAFQIVKGKAANLVQAAMLPIVYDSEFIFTSVAALKKQATLKLVGLMTNSIAIEVK